MSVSVIAPPSPAVPAAPSAATARRRVLLVLAAAAPAVVLRLTGAEVAAPVGAAVFGIGVLAAALLLMWAAETARADIGGALALALLAFIAVLPEYAVDLYFAYSGGRDPANAAYASANMTGANRLLIGVGWPLVAVAGLLAARRRRARAARTGTTAPADPDTDPGTDIVLVPHRRIDIGFLAVASVFAFVMPFTRQIAWYVPLVLIPWYGYYLWRIGRCADQQPEQQVGVAARLARLPARPRRLASAALFAAAAAVIFSVAEPFANSLVSAGGSLGIDRFLLVQWVAPLASEAPELVVAVVFAWRLRGDDGLGALLSSKVNQWTLLVATLPLAYALGGGGFGLPLTGRQVDEVALTAAQTVLAVVILLDLRLRIWEAASLYGLFATQFLLPAENSRMILTYVYLALAATLLVPRRRHLLPSLRAVGGTIPGDNHRLRPPRRATEPATGGGGRRERT